MEDNCSFQKPSKGFGELIRERFDQYQPQFITYAEKFIWAHFQKHIASIKDSSQKDNQFEEIKREIEENAHKTEEIKQLIQTQIASSKLNTFEW